MKLCHSDGGAMSHQEVRIAGKKQGDKPFIGKESFPCVLYTMLEEVESHGLAHIVSWQPHGRCFVVHRRRDFCSMLLPVYFRMSKFPSFQRQLNLYGFQRITTGRDKGGYYHELFLRGRKDLSKTIPRQQVKGAGPRKPAMPEAEPNFYLMDFMPATGSEAASTNSTAAASLSGLMIPSATNASASQPSLESSWMSSLYPSIFMAPSAAATSSALTNALQQQQLQQPHHGMMVSGSGAMEQGNFDSLVAALGGSTSASQFGFMRQANANLLPSSTAANRFPNLGGDSSLFSMLNPGALPTMPSFEPSNADLMRREVSVAAANFRNAPAMYGQQDRDTGNILLDAYAAALQSEFTDHGGAGAFRRRPSSGDDSFRDFISRNSSA